MLSQKVSAEVVTAISLLATEGLVGGSPENGMIKMQRGGAVLKL